MKFFTKKQKKTNEYGDLETKLDSIFHPIAPQPEFVRNLRERLVGMPEEEKILGLSKRSLESGLLLFGGVVSILLLVFAGIRAIFTLLSAIGLLQAGKKLNETSSKSNPGTPVG